MPRRFTLGELVTLCKQRIDREYDEAISDTEWKWMISTQYGELYSIVAESGMRYFETATVLTTDGSSYVAEPSNHLATIGIDYLIDGTTTGKRRELREIMAQERNVFAGQTGVAQAYALVDDQIRLYPIPPTGQKYELIYIPQPPKLGDQADGYAVDVVTADGEAFIIWGVAVQALRKEDGDLRDAKQEREEARARIADWAAMRAFHEPRRRMPGDDMLGGWSDPAEWRTGGGW